MSKLLVRMSLNAISHKLGTDTFSEANEITPQQAVRNLRQFVMTLGESSLSAKTHDDSLRYPDHEFIHLNIAKLENLLALDRPLTSGETVSASTAINYLVKSLLNESLDPAPEKGLTSDR